MISDTCPFCNEPLIFDGDFEYYYLFSCNCKSYRLLFDKVSEKIWQEQYTVNFVIDVTISFKEKIIYIENFNGYTFENIETLQCYPTAGYLKLFESRSLL